MSITTLSSLVLILAVIALAPVISDAVDRWVRLPSVVIEIMAGVLIGPALGWVKVDDVIDFFSQFGLAFLMFLAGLEIDLTRVRGRPLNRAVAGWAISVVLGVAIGFALTDVDGTRSGLIVGLAITTTALGMLLPILRDSGELQTDFGTHVLAGASIGNFGPIVAVTVLLGTDRPAKTALVMFVFVAVVGIAAWLALRERNARLARLIEATLTTSSQFAIRLVVLFLMAMVWLADELGLDMLLGAFAAGMVAHLFVASSSPRELELVEAKLHGIGFGFFVPIFFVVSGITFDLDSVIDDPLVLLVVPLVLLAFFVVRGTPTALLQREMSRLDRCALASYLATGLPLVVVITSIGVSRGRLSSATAACLVTAAMVSVIVYPLLAARLRSASPTRVEVGAER
jgi:Kef-type K+ transport system membrane component KefB